MKKPSVEASFSWILYSVTPLTPMNRGLKRLLSALVLLGFCGYTAYPDE